MTTPDTGAADGAPAGAVEAPGATRRDRREGAGTRRGGSPARPVGRTRSRMRVLPATVLAVVGLVAGVGSGAAVSTATPSPPLVIESDLASGVSVSPDQRQTLLEVASRGLARTALTDSDSLLPDSTAPSDDTAAPGPLAPPDVAPPLEPAVLVPEPLPLPEGVDAAGFAAGLLSTSVPDAASGVFDVVPGEVPAPGAGEVKSVRIEVERGLDVDPVMFADQVLSTLNDPRSWGGDGSQSFSRTAGEATLTVTLASPTSVDRLCAPLDTVGLWSCGIEGRAVLNHMRWVKGSGTFGDDMASYRHYLVNHEVGHVLGHRHSRCSSSTALADVMVQQSGPSIACLPNGWPFP